MWWFKLTDLWYGGRWNLHSHRIVREAKTQKEAMEKIIKFVREEEPKEIKLHEKCKLPTGPFKSEKAADDSATQEYNKKKLEIERLEHEKIEHEKVEREEKNKIRV